MTIQKALVIDLIDLLNKAFEYEGDVFGYLHNDAVDALSTLQRLLQEYKQS